MLEPSAGTRVLGKRPKIEAKIDRGELNSVRSAVENHRVS